MKNLLIVLIVSLSVSSQALAKPKAYVDVNDSFWNPDPKVVIDGKEYRAGFLGFNGLPEAMSSNPEAAALAASYESYQKWSAGLLWGGLIAALAYSFSTDNDEYESGVYWGIFAGGFIPAIVLGARAQTKFARAINQYNGVYSNETSWEITPADKGLGLALRF